MNFWQIFGTMCSVLGLFLFFGAPFEGAVILLSGLLMFGFGRMLGGG